jgi:hypothetical protein
MNEMTIFDIKITDSIDMICYEGDYNEIYDDEDKLCHYFRIKPINKNILVKLNNKLIGYVVYIDESNKEIEFYDYDRGDSILLNYIKIEELNFEHKEVIRAKIKYLLNKDEENDKILGNIIAGVNNTITYLNKELGNINTKIQFFEQNNNTKNLFKNIGKKEMVEKILDKLNKI